MEGVVTNYKLAIMAALVMVAAIGTNAVRLSDCKISVDDLMLCRSAINAPEIKGPVQDRCCAALKAANLPCLCSFSSYMPAFGVEREQATQLLAKCGIPDSFHCK